MLSHHRVSGTWRGRTKDGSFEVVVDYSAGLLVTTATAGDVTRGPPEAFQSTTGESGLQVLQRLIRPPNADSLRLGAIRESLASVRSVAFHGFQETRAMEGSTDYVIETGEGSCGVVRFSHNGCVGAMINYDPWRQLDQEGTISRMPPTLQEIAREVCALPILNAPAQLAISSLFWSEGGPLTSAESWLTSYTFGGELLRRELLDDDAWRAEAGAHHELDEAALTLVALIARRRQMSSGGLALDSAALSVLAPDGAPRRADALQLLGDMGYVIEAGAPPVSG